MERRIYTAAEIARPMKSNEKQVIRLAEHGELQGRKIQGKWLFSMADVVLYLENKLGGEDNRDFLDSMETVAENYVPQQDSVDEATLGGLLKPESIMLPFSAKTKDSVIRELTAKGVALGKIWDPDRMIEALHRREEMMSTAMECGVALLHPRRPMPDNIAESFVILGVALRGLPFGGGYNNLTDIFFLVCAIDDKTHLRLLAEIGRLLNRPGFLDTLRELNSPREVSDWIQENL